MKQAMVLTATGQVADIVCESLKTSDHRGRPNASVDGTIVMLTGKSVSIWT